MVRLEMQQKEILKTQKNKFTFQYGQIRNPVGYIPKSQGLDDLHSSMVRLEIYSSLFRFFVINIFTFQYGQIRNSLPRNSITVLSLHLHSSMVRLEMPYNFNISNPFLLFTFQYGQIRNITYYCIQTKKKLIYIPVWLDQKSKKAIDFDNGMRHLHSSMVRLEIKRKRALCRGGRKIYIPVWLDQK